MFSAAEKESWHDASTKKWSGTPALSTARHNHIDATWLLAPSAIQDFEQFVDLDLAVTLGAAMEGVRHTMLQMISQRLLFDLVQCGANGADLGQHVDAVAFFLDHAGNAADLALDAAEARELRFLDFLIHGLHHTPVGYR